MHMGICINILKRQEWMISRELHIPISKRQRMETGVAKIPVQKTKVKKFSSKVYPENF